MADRTTYAPGVHPDMPLDHYYADPAQSDHGSVNASNIPTLREKSPLHFATRAPVLTARYSLTPAKDTPSAASRRGNVVHRLALGKGSDYEVRDYPIFAPRKRANGATKWTRREGPRYWKRTWPTASASPTCCAPILTNCSWGRSGSPRWRYCGQRTRRGASSTAARWWTHGAPSWCTARTSSPRTDASRAQYPSSASSAGRLRRAGRVVFARPRTGAGPRPQRARPVQRRLFGETTPPHASHSRSS
jgi:hypothetical protein